MPPATGSLVVLDAQLVTQLLDGALLLLDGVAHADLVGHPFDGVQIALELAPPPERGCPESEEDEHRHRAGPPNRGPDRAGVDDAGETEGDRSDLLGDDAVRGLPHCAD